jgi:hypothetical protein
MRAKPKRLMAPIHPGLERNHHPSVGRYVGTLGNVSLTENGVYENAIMSKNAITIEHLNITCRHVIELMDVGMTENLAIRSLELFANVYAKMRVVGSASPDYADQYKLWSKAALLAKATDPKQKYAEYLRVEHGTPRRQFARLVLGRFRKGRLLKGVDGQSLRHKMGSCRDYARRRQTFEAFITV